MFIYFYQTEIGNIGIAESNGKITNLYFENDIIKEDVRIEETDLIKEAFFQLEKYLKGELKTFDLPLEPSGTLFMKQVWSSLTKIPYGTTNSYKDIAFSINKQKAARAVGLANNKNPIPIFIPCHRVVGSNGKLVGYRGGIDLKKTLLDLEARFK